MQTFSCSPQSVGVLALLSESFAIMHRVHLTLEIESMLSHGCGCLLCEIVGFDAVVSSLEIRIVCKGRKDMCAKEGKIWKTERIKQTLVEIQ